jgi:hypothetical protein
MTTTRAWTRCRRAIAGQPCNRQLRDHEPHTRACPGGTGETFQKHHAPPNQASQSFTRAEVEALSFALAGLREGKDLRIFARHKSPVLGSIARKVQVMRKSINRRNAAQQEESSGDQEERQTETASASTPSEAGIG